MDKRVTKCKDAWLKFYRTYNQGTFGRIANKIKERDARMGSMNPDDYQDPLCSDLLSLILYSRMSNELLEFLQEDLKDSDRLGTLNDKLEENLQSIIDEFNERILPALKKTLGIVLGLRAKLKATISIHGKDSPFTLGFKLEHLNSIVEYLEKHTLLCETVVSKLT